MTYNCGNDEETFNTKNYYPSNEEEKSIMIFLNANMKQMKKIVIKNLLNFLMIITNAAGAKKILSFPSISHFFGFCKAYPISGLKNKFEEILKQNKDKKFKMRCTCTYKKGKQVAISLNSFYNKITIE